VKEKLEEYNKLTLTSRKMEEEHKNEIELLKK